MAIADKNLTGYRDLTQEEVDIINEIKQKEIEIGALHKKVLKVAGRDLYAHDVAKEHLQTGFMWLVKSVARPADPFK